MNLNFVVQVFFRRSLQKGTVYKCAEDNCCEILPGRRSACSACRFNKCIALGMCKEGDTWLYLFIDNLLKISPSDLGSGYQPPCFFQIFPVFSVFFSRYQVQKSLCLLLYLFQLIISDYISPVAWQFCSRGPPDPWGGQAWTKARRRRKIFLELVDTCWWVLELFWWNACPVKTWVLGADFPKFCQKI